MIQKATENMVFRCFFSSVWYDEIKIEPKTARLGVEEAFP